MSNFKEMLQTLLTNQRYAESAFAYINEVISTLTIGIESTINILTSAPSNNVASLIKSFFL